jgi:hypothetical protein
VKDKDKIAKAILNSIQASIKMMEQKDDATALYMLKRTVVPMEQLYASLKREENEEKDVVIVKTMTYGEMINKIECDLKISHHKARDYMDLFREQYNGRKEAISSISASYTKYGQIRINYVIDNKRHYVLI